MSSGTDAERLERSHKDKNGSPPMPHGERKMHEQLIAGGLGRVILFDDIIDVADGRGDQEGEDEGGDVMVVGPDGDEGGVEEGEEREPPGDSVNHDGLCVGGSELVDNGAEKEEVDDRPSEEGPTSWSEVRLLDVSVDVVWGGYGVDVRPQEEEINDDVNDFEEKTIFPLCSSHCFLVRVLVGEEEGGREAVDTMWMVKWTDYISDRGVDKGRHQRACSVSSSATLRHAEIRWSGYLSRYLLFAFESILVRDMLYSSDTMLPLTSPYV